MKKRHLMITLVLTAIAVTTFMLAGCSAVGGGSDDLKIEYGRTIDESMKYRESIAFVITNTSDKAATNLSVKVVPYDADGKVISYGEDDPGTERGAYGAATQLFDIQCIMPGEKCGRAAFGFEDLKDIPDHIDVVVDKVKWKDPSEIEGGDLVLEDYSYYAGSDDITLTVKNETDIVYDINDPLMKHAANFHIIAFDSDGNITGGTFGTFNQKLEPGNEYTTTEHFDPDMGMQEIPADSVEVYLERYDASENGNTVYFDEEGNSYTEEEYIQHLKDTGQYDG